MFWWTCVSSHTSSHCETKFDELPLSFFCHWLPVTVGDTDDVHPSTSQSLLSLTQFSRVLPHLSRKEPRWVKASGDTAVILDKIASRTRDTVPRWSLTSLAGSNSYWPMRTSSPGCAPQRTVSRQTCESRATGNSIRTALQKHRRWAWKRTPFKQMKNVQTDVPGSLWKLHSVRPSICTKEQTVTGTLVPTYFRSTYFQRKYHRWNFRSLVLSLPGTCTPCNFRSLELSLPGTLAPE